ncbi:hypothetical protein AB0D04_10270 [Streptomyces sp. NPDC048483]|uniref:hypothetical protein n=1 Tax=Streptomyces sp. NPDC048483 TaxID=3154927 RepID=UPI0034410102
MVTNTTQETPRSTHASTLAVLYVCVERGTGAHIDPGLPASRAREEGHSFARRHGLTITHEITDAFGEPAPHKRAGWNKVRELVQRGEVGAVIVRWPTAISPDHEQRYDEVRWCKDHGSGVLFSWAPLAAMAGCGATR